MKKGIRERERGWGWWCVWLFIWWMILAYIMWYTNVHVDYYIDMRDHHGRDHMVVGYTTTCAISAYHHWSCEFEPCS